MSNGWIERRNEKYLKKMWSEREKRRLFYCEWIQLVGLLAWIYNTGKRRHWIMSLSRFKWKEGWDRRERLYKFRFQQFHEMVNIKYFVLKRSGVLHYNLDVLNEMEWYFNWWISKKYIRWYKKFDRQEARHICRT